SGRRRWRVTRWLSASRRARPRRRRSTRLRDGDIRRLRRHRRCMIDQRFYEALGPLTVRALAPSADIGGDPERIITGAAPADRAKAEDVCYYAPKGAKPLTTAPGACIIQPALAHLVPNAGALILADNPRAAFARLIPSLIRPRAFEGEAIHPSARLEEGVQ